MFVFWKLSGNVARNSGVLFLPVQSIRPNPDQPRRVFDPEALQTLAESVRMYGIIQPLTVRRTAGGWQLVAGERRLRAAKLAGLTEVPCLLMEVSDETSGLFALIENLQRKDLDYMEQAQGMAGLMEKYGLSQEQVARRLGKSQSAVANKLRLLKHPPAVVEVLRERGLSERHARALLRVEDPEKRLTMALRTADEGWSVAKLEQVLDSAEERPPRFLWRTTMLKDARLLLNSVEHALQAARAAGLEAMGSREETDTEIVLTIRLPKPAK